MYTYIEAYFARFADIFPSCNVASAQLYVSMR